ncbi:signaling lymphocytic activation molecule isoform 2-T2 [Menidia menidia]
MGRVLLLVLVAFHGVGASAGSRLIQKKVGDDVEISSDLPTEGVTTATWKYGERKIVDLSRTFKDNQFLGRLEFNHKNFSLTLRRLTLQDSGEYLFLSGTDEEQRPTVTITLQVHEPITAPPVLSANLSLQANGSCAVWLECTAAAHRNVLYSWTVGGHSHSGPRLQYLLTPPEEDATFTCTASNFVSSQSQSTTLTCASREQKKGSGSSLIVTVVRLFVGFLLVLLLVFLLRCTKTNEICCDRWVQPLLVSCKSAGKKTHAVQTSRSQSEPAACVLLPSTGRTRDGLRGGGETCRARSVGHELRSEELTDEKSRCGPRCSSHTRAARSWTAGPETNRQAPPHTVTSPTGLRSLREQTLKQLCSSTSLFMV